MTYEAIAKAVEKLHQMFDRTDVEVEWKKLQEKFEEARYNPGDIRPFADCILSVLLAARNQGFGAETVLKELDKLAGEYLQKRWKRMPDGTYRAV